MRAWTWNYPENKHKSTDILKKKNHRIEWLDHNVF